MTQILLPNAGITVVYHSSFPRAVVLNLPNGQPFNTVPFVVVTPIQKIISQLRHNCHFATVVQGI